MKNKKIKVSLFLMFAIIIGVNVGFSFSKGDSKFGRLEALAECENTVKTDGGIILVTVCYRKTSVADFLVNLSCASSATSSCSFTNSGSARP